MQMKYQLQVREIGPVIKHFLTSFLFISQIRPKLCMQIEMDYTNEFQMF